MPPPVRALRYTALWQCVGALLVLLAIYLSLTPSPPGAAGIAHVDKLGHGLMYAGLMGWFVQIYVRRAGRAVLAAAFIGLGAVLEVLQGLGGVRMFEWGDMLANASGVLIALGLANTRADEVLLRLERRWLVPRAD